MSKCYQHQGLAHLTSGLRPVRVSEILSIKSWDRNPYTKEGKNKVCMQGDLGWSDISLTVCVRVIQTDTKKKHQWNVII